jgi:hypothetical protein
MGVFSGNVSPLTAIEQANGDIVVSPGSITRSSPPRLWVACPAHTDRKFSSTGILQSTATPGTTVAASTNAFTTTPEMLQPDGEYLVAASFGVGRHTSDIQVSRFRETGAADSSFVTTPFKFGAAGANSPQAIALQLNGQAVVAGTTSGNVWVGAAAPDLQVPGGPLPMKRRPAGNCSTVLLKRKSCWSVEHHGQSSGTQ